jgi:kynureninase
MNKNFVPFSTAEAWQLSNPSIFATAPLLASLEIFYEATHEKRIEKSKKLTQFLLDLLVDDDRLEIITPPKHGAQLSIKILREDAKKIFEQLEPHGVIVDWREPDVIRVAPAPLYNSFQDVWHFTQILKSLLSI